MLILHLPLTGDIHNQGLLEEETYITQDLTYSDNGKLGKCLQFNGDPKQILSFVNIPKKKNNFTWACWIKQTNRTSTVYQKTTQYVLSMGRDCGTIGFNIRMINGYLNIHLGSGEDTNTTTSITNKAINIQELQLNIWYHICCIVDNESVNVYINGELVKTFLLVDISYRSNSHGYFTIGKMGYNNDNTYAYFPFNGLIQDVRVYDTAISPRQVKEISKGLVCHYPLGEVDGKIGGRNLLKGSSIWTKDNPAKSSSAADGYVYIGGSVYLEKGKTYTLQAVCDTVWSSKHKGDDGTATIWIHTSKNEYKCFTGDNKTSGRYTWTFVWSYDSQNCNIRVNGYNKVVNFWNIKIESGNKATPWTPAPEDDASFYDNVIYDTSGYCNNGSVTDSTCPTWSSDTPRYKGSYVFNGNNQYISGLSPITSSTKEFSIACWVYLNKLGITMTLFTARTAVGFGIALFVTNDKLRFYDNTRSSFNYSLQDKNWFHLCVTRNEDKKKLYINGQLVEESSDVGDMQNIGKYFTIGGSEASDTGIATDNFLNGKLSDFRIYATALSDTDIIELYQSSASVDNNGNLMLAGEVIEE